MKLNILSFILLLFPILNIASAATLNDWISSEIATDERLMEDAFSQKDGLSLELLKFSKTYVPFFLEKPSSLELATKVDDDVLFEALFERYKGRHHPGGYVYRLKFKAAPPLYAMSAGEWDGNDWHSLSLVNDLEIEDSQVWESLKRDCLYTTLLAGPRPRLISYNRSGEVAHQETFDVSDNDFEQQLQAALAPYSSSEKPVLEMISLAEYLQQPNAIWRLLDVSGRFNLRNQHQRPDEQERLKQIGHLTRSAAVSALTTDTATTHQPKPTLRPPPFVRPPQKQSAEPKLSPTGSLQPTPSMPWSLIVILMAAATGLAWLLLKKRN
jgi:hypothetical protein